MRKLFSILVISLLSTQGLLLSTMFSYAETSEAHPQPLLIAFDGFDDEASDASGSDDSSDDTMDEGGSAEPSEPDIGEEAPDEGFKTGYSQDNE